METEECFQDLSKFIFKRVLSDSSHRKSICVEGEFADKEGSTVLLLEKQAFTEENVKHLCSEESTLKKTFVNDVYGSYEILPKTDLNGKILKKNILFMFYRTVNKKKLLFCRY